jgi:hypothetical protein
MKYTSPQKPVKMVNDILNAILADKDEIIANTKGLTPDSIKNSLLYIWGEIRGSVAVPVRLDSQEEITKRLIDADAFLPWVRERGIEYKPVKSGNVYADIKPQHVPADGRHTAVTGIPSPEVRETMAFNNMLQYVQDDEHWKRVAGPSEATKSLIAMTKKAALSRRERYMYAVHYPSRTAGGIPRSTAPPFAVGAWYDIKGKPVVYDTFVYDSGESLTASEIAALTISGKMPKGSMSDYKS